MNNTNLPKTVTALALTLATIFVMLICLTTVTAQPELFLITGEVLKPDGSPCNGPCVHVTNQNTARSWDATNNSTSNYFQLLLRSDDLISANDVLLVETSGPGCPKISIEYVITQDMINNGGFRTYGYLRPVSLQPDLLIANNSNIITTTIKNDGPSVSPVDLVLKLDEVIIETRTLESLNMSEEITLNYLYTPVVRGTFNLTITIDPENKIGQLNHNLTIHDLILEVEIIKKPGVVPGYWMPDSEIISGLGDNFSMSAPTIFEKDGTLYLISGASDGMFYGYHRTGSEWQQDDAIVSGLGDVGNQSGPTVFCMNETWYLIAGREHGFNGFNWTGSAWQQDDVIVSGLHETTNGINKPVVFYKDDAWYLISGSKWEHTGSFSGYKRNGSVWEDSSIISGLPAYTHHHHGAPTVFYDDKIWYLISGRDTGVFPGWNMIGSSWNSDSDLTIGLRDVGSWSTPFVFCVDETRYLISGEYSGGFYGFRYIPAQAVIPDLIPTSLQPTVFAVNQPSIIMVNVKNVGGAADSFNVSLKLNDEQIAIQTVDSLGAGEQTIVNFTYTPVSGGTFNMTATVDPDNILEELNDENNIITTPISVLRPDLVPKTLQPVAFLTNETNTITTTIKNEGGVPAGSFNISVQFNQELIGTKTVGSLGTGEETTVNFTYTPTTQGIHSNLTVTVDTENIIGESDETNNILTIQARTNTIWHVYEGGSIQGTIDNASDYDTIIVHPGTYNSSTISIGKRLTIEGIDHPVIDFNGKQIGINIRTNGGGDGTTVRGFKLINIRNIVNTLAYGINFNNNDNILIEDNIIEGHLHGIAIRATGYNHIIRRNTISDAKYSFCCQCSICNVYVYLNDFINGTDKGYNANDICTAHSPEMVTYIYHGETYTGYLGNYWEAYNGTDSDGDGIGDTSYMYAKADDPELYWLPCSYDYYPLMEPNSNYIVLNKPDITVKEIITPDFVYTNTSSLITAVISNAGTCDAGSFNVVLYADSEPVETVTFNSLDFDASVETDFVWTSGLVGPVNLSVVADTAGVIDELNEKNNASEVMVMVKEEPTPFLISGAVNYDTGDPIAGPAVTLTYLTTFENFVVETSSSSNHYRALTDSRYVCAGEMIRINASFESTYSVEQHTITQDEIDNGGIYNLDITLSTIPVPELVVPGIVLKKVGYAGEQNVLGMVVKNTGRSDTGQFNVMLEIDGVLLDERIIPSLNAGDSVDIEFEWTPPHTGGYVLNATVDANNDVNESDETNNVFMRRCVIISKYDWGQFHYDASGIGFSPSGAPSTDNVKWTSAGIGAGGGLAFGGFSDMGPLVADGQIFTYCGTSGFGSDPYDVACLDEETGELLWKITLPYPMVYGSWSPIGYDDGMVFCTVNHYCLALDADDGSIVWECDLDSPEYDRHAWNVNGGPMIAQGKVFVGTYDDEGIGGAAGGLAGYVAIDEYTGEKIWQTTGDSHCDSTPAYYDGVVYVGFDNCWVANYSGGVYALNASTGEVIWDTWLSFSVWGSVCVDEDYVYGANYNFYGPAELFILYRNNGTVKVISESLRTDSTPAVAYDNIYICGGCSGYSDTGTFCVDKETLEVIWSAPAGSWTASPAVADNKVYVGGYCYDAHTGEELFSYEQGGLSPVIANNKLFNVKNGQIICFEDTVSTLPDLTVTGIETSSNLYVDVDSLVNATIKNTGLETAADFNVSFAVDGVMIDTVSLTSIAAGESLNVEFNWTPGTTGDHTLIISVDINDDVNESDETNNILSEIVNVGTHALIMDIGDHILTPGSSVSAPVTIHEITDYGTITMQIEYDPLIAWVTGIDDSQNSTVTGSNINNPAGYVTLSAWNTSGASGDIIIAHVTFETRGTSGSTPLNLTVTTLQDTSYHDIPLHVVDGSFTINENTGPIVTNPESDPYTILNDNGRVRVSGTNISTLSVSVTDNTGIGSVTVDLSPIGGDSMQPMTHASGNTWTIDVNATGGINETHCLSVNATDTNGNSNTDTCILLTVLRRGDVVRDNEVDIVDAYYIARYTVGLESEPDGFVADVTPAYTQDGVDIVDAYYIARYTVGLEVAP